MRAVEMVIHNFRSICDMTIHLEPCSMLVGANNSGKSSVIDAARAFYGKIKFEHGRDYPKKGASDDDSWVEIEFKPTQEEIDTLKEEYRSANDTFRVRNYLHSKENGEDGKAKSGPYAYVNGELSGERFYGFKNVGQGKFGEIIYIPAVSKIDEHTKLTGPSALRDLVNAVLSDVLESSTAYAELCKSFTSFETNLKSESTGDGRSLHGIETDVSEELEPWGASFQLKINPMGIDEIVRGLIGHEIVDGELGKNQPISSYGQGFQRSVIYTLIKVAAQYTSSKRVPKKKEFSPELTWILFEEPEAFLHPDQARSLSVALRAMSLHGANQVLMSTHSPLFVSQSIDDIPALCRLRRADCCTRAFQVTPTELSEILADNQADVQAWRKAGITVDPDDLTIDMEAIKYALWLDSRRCESFFAEKVLLVEGPTETALVTYLKDKGYLSTISGVFALDCIGKWNMHRFMRLFGSLGVEHYVIYDDDGGRNAPVSATILATANSYTKGIDSFAVDLEEFLGLPKVNSQHRKPQHVLYQLSSGSVDGLKLNALIEKIEALLGRGRDA